jgi:Transposase DDE domain group 1
MKRSKRFPALKVTPDGKGVAAHAGSRLLAEMAEATGLIGAMSEAMAPTVVRRRHHDPGQVLVDLAVTIADGGDCLSDLAVLRNQPSLFGAVASIPTASRVVDTVDAERLNAIRGARARARAAAWTAGLDPTSKVNPLVLDFDATLVDSHSEKENAAPTYKRGFGFSPLLCYLDATGEALAAILRPGNAAPHNPADHIALLEMALAQLPVKPDGKDGVAMLVRADSAGSTHAFVDALRDRGIEFSVGFRVREEVRLALCELDESAWFEAMTQDMDVREEAQVAELTETVDLSTWPVGTRMIVRRELPHPGATFNLFDPQGYRHQVFLCDSTDPDIAYLEARHRGHARIEDRIRSAKDTGLRNLPFPAFANNACWVELVLMAQDLMAFAQGLVLDGDLATAEPKRLRYTLLHTAGRITTTGRTGTLHIQREWPWARQLADAFERLRAIPFVT